MRMAIRRPSSDNEQAGATNAKPRVPAQPVSPPTVLPEEKPAAPSDSPSVDRPSASPNQPGPAAQTGTTEDADPPAADLPVEPTSPPPAVPLSAVQRRQRTIKNLTRIGQAMEAYVKANGRYPARSISAADGAPLLSWRGKTRGHIVR